MTHSNDNIGHVSIAGKHGQPTDGLFIANDILQLNGAVLLYPETQDIEESR